MASGYTYGVVDGTTKDFNTFALDCARAFGALAHLRDEPRDKPYTPRTPSDYYQEAIDEKTKLLEEAKTRTLAQYKEYRKKEIQSSINYYKEEQEESKLKLARIQPFLEKAKALDIEKYPEHKEYKAFIIKQLEDTIEWDCKLDRYDKRILELENDLKDLESITDISYQNGAKKSTIADLERNIKYYTDKKAEEQEYCDESNRWMEELCDIINRVPETIQTKNEEA